MVWNAGHCPARKAEGTIKPSNARRSTQAANHAAARDNNGLTPSCRYTILPAINYSVVP
jgi:hypothetical protein